MSRGLLATILAGAVLAGCAGSRAAGPGPASTAASAEASPGPTPGAAKPGVASADVSGKTAPRSAPQAAPGRPVDERAQTPTVGHRAPHAEGPLAEGVEAFRAGRWQ